MSEGPQFTKCVERADWVSPVAAIGVADIAAVFVAIAAAIAGFPLAGLIVGFAAGAEVLRKLAEWLLNGKLICLKNVKRRVFNDADPDRVCALGTVLDFEKVGEDKSGIENIDNDFGLNLFIAPFAISEVNVKDHDVLKAEMEGSPQGDLIQNPASAKRKDDPTQDFGALPHASSKIFVKHDFGGMERQLMFSAIFARPVPSNVFRDPHELVKIDPKFQQMANDAYAAFVAEFQGVVTENGQPLSKGVKDAILAEAAKDPLAEPRVTTKFYAAVDTAYHFNEKAAQALHCEFEGSRMRDVYNVLDFAHVQCDTSGFWGFLCDVLNFVISLVLGLPKLIAAAVAWASAADGSLSDSYDGKGGAINYGDPIVVRGRWCFDSGHDGYNELHAVRTVQKTLPSPRDTAGFLAFYESWCSELAKVPPSPPPTRDPNEAPPGAGTPPMTPPQQATADAQGRDENRWVYHPAIDGCTPAASPVPRPR